MEIQLLRQYHANGTNGQLYSGGKKIGYTIELPWLNNQRRISCSIEATNKNKLGSILRDLVSAAPLIDERCSYQDLIEISEIWKSRH